MASLAQRPRRICLGAPSSHRLCTQRERGSHSPKRRSPDSDVNGLAISQWPRLVGHAPGVAKVATEPGVLADCKLLQREIIELRSPMVKEPCLCREMVSKCFSLAPRPASLADPCGPTLPPHLRPTGGRSLQASHQKKRLEVPGARTKKAAREQPVILRCSATFQRQGALCLWWTPV